MIDAEIRELHISGFQSLAAVKLPLGRFTAIVGPSNIGKSAVVRALKLLCESGPSTGFVRAGEKQLQVSIEFEDGVVVQTSRGPRLSEYMLRLPELGERTFAKCGVAVPEAVASVLYLSRVTFAGQHDSPFMLSEPGSAMAVRLGELTNVSTVAEAVRIANRRRLEASQDDKARTREFDELVAELKNHADLKDRRGALRMCRVLVTEAAQAEDREQILAKLIGDARAAGVDLKEAQEAAERHSGADALIAAAEAAGARWATLQGQWESWTQALYSMNDAEGIAIAAEAEAEKLEAQVHVVLNLNGQCPVCGQAVA